ncbi:ParB family chromosome partitioning protein [Rhizobium leguminosarum]
MTPYEYRKIDVSLLDVPANRLRGIKPHRVETLSKDMAVNGQLQPIIVTEQDTGRFVLVKGLQRLEAVKANKRFEIDARVTPIAWLQAGQTRLQEIMATLNREDFTKLERAEALAELKILHEQLYPETKKGVAGGKARQGSANEIFSFAQTAAEATGLSRRSIELAVAMVNTLAIATKIRVRGTWLENDQSGLTALSKESGNLQSAALDMLLAEPAEASSVAEALLLAQGLKPADPVQKTYQSVLDKWKRFPIAHKRNFIDANEDEIVRILREKGSI